MPTKPYCESQFPSRIWCMLYVPWRHPLKTPPKGKKHRFHVSFRRLVPKLHPMCVISFSSRKNWKPLMQNGQSVGWAKGKCGASSSRFGTKKSTYGSNLGRYEFSWQNRKTHPRNLKPLHSVELTYPLQNGGWETTGEGLFLGLGYLSFREGNNNKKNTVEWARRIV